MSLYVQWADKDYQKNDNLLDLCSTISRPMWKILEKEMTPEETAVFREKGSGTETITPDGSSDFDKPTGIINFYIAGIPQRLLQPILKEIKETLQNIGIPIEYNDMKIEQSGLRRSKVIRIPITKNDNVYKGPPEFNLANGNATALYRDILGFQPEDDGASYSFTVEELEQAIQPYIQDRGRLSPHTIHPSDEQEPGGPRMISGGRNLNQLYRYIERLQEVIKWCKEHDYKYLYVA
jgi:hypothetical protein